MAEKKIIAVVGATGAQGGSLVRAILSDTGGDFTVRALTRSPTADKAKNLANLGAEVVAADVDDAESLRRGFEGAYGAFCVTFFWEHFSPERELAQATAMAHAAKHAGLQHVVWSTLEDTRQWVRLDDNRMPTLMDNYKVPHFDAKGEANHVFIELACRRRSCSLRFIGRTSSTSGWAPRRDRTVLWRSHCLWVTKSCLVSPLRTSASAPTAFGRRRVDTKRSASPASISRAPRWLLPFTRALGQEVRYNGVSPDVYRRLGFPGAGQHVSVQVRLQ